MFASHITKDVEIEDGASIVVVTVRKLSGASLQKAREARSAAQLASLRSASRDLLLVMRSPELEAAGVQLAEQKAKAAPDSASRAKARYDAHERDVVLNAGIVRWSAVEPVNPDRIADLDESTAQRLHEEILDLSLPPLEGEATAGKAD